MSINIRKLLGLPTKSNELTYWGTLDFKNGKYGSALKYFNAALLLDPSNEFIKGKIDDVLKEMGSEQNQIHESTNITSSINLNIESKNSDSGHISYHFSCSSNSANDEFILDVKRTSSR